MKQEGRGRLPWKWLTTGGSKQNFIKNGKLLLEERVTLFHGKTYPIRCLSIHDLSTKFQDWVLDGTGYLGIRWYKCVWDGRPVLAKLFTKHAPSEICREIAVATQMSIHNNVHKLLACCLETNLPVLIYEFVQHGFLMETMWIREKQRTNPLGWKDSLRVLWEISHAVAYLHSAFPRPIVHRDLTPVSVLLDHNNAAKLTCFHLAVCIPKGELHVVADYISGIRGYLDPQYVHTKVVAENVDVYAFGVLLLELLTGLNFSNCSDSVQIFTKAARLKHFAEIVDPVVIRDEVLVNENLHQQLLACIDIAAKCVAPEKDSRPTMEQVATELKNIIMVPEPPIPTTGTGVFFQNLSLSQKQFESSTMVFYGSHQNFIKNERLLLEQTVSLFLDKPHPFSYLSLADLNTNFKDWILYSKFGAWRWYRCVWEGTFVLAKIFEEGFSDNEILVGCCREIAIATHMAAHKNVHKFLTCCLETEKPVLIYEFVENGCLQDVIYRSQNQMIPPLGWKHRLRIAWEISHAVACLHSAFPLPIVYRDLNPINVYLDQDNVPKLANFCNSVFIREGEIDVKGPLCYLVPTSFYTEQLTKNADVYYFGFFILLVLLTGLQPLDQDFLRARECLGTEQFTKFVDPVIVGSGAALNEDLKQQLQACIEIVIRCSEVEKDIGPTMEKLATELESIFMSCDSSIEVDIPTIS